MEFYEDSNHSLVLAFSSDKSIRGMEEDLINRANKMLVSNYPSTPISNENPTVAQNNYNQETESGGDNEVIIGKGLIPMHKGGFSVGKNGISYVKE